MPNRDGKGPASQRPGGGRRRGRCFEGEAFRGFGRGDGEGCRSESGIFGRRSSTIKQSAEEASPLSKGLSRLKRRRGEDDK